LSFDIGNFTPTPEPIDLSVTNTEGPTGLFTLVIDSTAWGLISSDAQLDISATNCAGYSGRVKISFPASGSTPANDYIIFLLFLVRSDGIVKE
jgi:hypothetical protein